MTFLELCQKTRLLAGISGTGPTTVTGQTGQLGLIVELVKTAWTHIQSVRQNWGWMWHEFSFETLTDGTTDYDPGTAAGLDYWNIGQFRVYKTADGQSTEGILSFEPFPVFRAKYGYGVDTDGKPAAITILPNNILRVHPGPDAAYTISGDYYALPIDLLNDNSTPDMPNRFHDVIVYKALMDWAANYGAPELFQITQKNYRDLFSRLEIDQLPKLTLKRTPLA